MRDKNGKPIVFTDWRQFWIEYKLERYYKKGR